MDNTLARPGFMHCGYSILPSMKANCKAIKGSNAMMLGNMMQSCLKICDQQLTVKKAEAGVITEKRANSKATDDGPDAVRLCCPDKDSTHGLNARHVCNGNPLLLGQHVSPADSHLFTSKFRDAFSALSSGRCVC
jgi:hypothetical protein